MALTVNTNVASLNAQRNLVRSSSGLQTSLERLSSVRVFKKQRIIGTNAAGMQDYYP